MRLVFIVAGFLILVGIVTTGCAEDELVPCAGEEWDCSCVTCHADKNLLQMYTVPAQNEIDGQSDSGVVWGELSPMESWEKVYLSDIDYLQTTHGKVRCLICHGGDSSDNDIEVAHEGMIADPVDIVCGTCHTDIVVASETNLHATLAGFQNALEARGGNLAAGSPLATAVDDNCLQCHTSCGQCHISRPDYLGGGLVSDHEFYNPPSMEENCLACHGSHTGDEYLGKNDGVEGDLHWTEQEMTCDECHGQGLHGSGDVTSNRYENPAAAACEDCHNDLLGAGANTHHQLHIGVLSCQVCHSVEYKNCYGCHLEIGDDGTYSPVIDMPVMGFKIGLNPVQTDERPYKYTVLRHVPVTPDTFESYGNNLLPDFNDVPTWKYSTPHNIQLKTEQNNGCNFCHTRTELFLLPGDVSPEELEANEQVIVREVP